MSEWVRFDGDWPIPEGPVDMMNRLYDEMALSIGYVADAWQRVEQELCQIFCAILGNRTAGTRSYYSIVNLNARLAMVNSVMVGVLRNRESVGDWNTLVKKMNQKAKIRNKVSHSSIDIVVKGGAQPIARLMPHLTNIAKFRN